MKIQNFAKMLYHHTDIGILKYNSLGWGFLQVVYPQSTHELVFIFALWREITGISNSRADWVLTIHTEKGAGNQLSCI